MGEGITMKKLVRIISLILALALLLSAAVVTAYAAADKAVGETDGRLAPSEQLDGYIYVTYESEQKYKYDISDGEFDGIAFGESVIIEAASSMSSNVLSLPANSTAFIVALADIETASGVYATIGDRQKISIDLYGHTLSMLGGFSVGVSNATPVSAELNIKNGVILLEGSIQAGKTNKMHQLISPKIGSKLSFENISLKNGTANSWGTLTYDGNAASIVFKNSVIDIGSNRPLFSLSPAYAGVNCNCKSCAENRAASGIAQLRSQLIFDNTTILSAKSLISQQANNCQIGGGKCIAIVDVYFKNGTEIVSASGNWESLFVFNMDGAEYDGSERCIYVESGTSFNKSEIVSSAVGARYEMNFVDVSGKPLGENMKLGNSGNEKFPYMLCTKSFKVEWYSHLGALLEEIEYAEGAIPSHTAPTHPDPFSMIEGSPFVKKHSGWTYTKDGASPDEILPLASDVKLYATYSDSPASVVVYDADGEAVDGWIESVISDLTVSKITEGATLSIYTDATIGATLPTNISFNIDLGGHTLVAASGNTKFPIMIPDADVRLFVAGGTLFSENSPAIVSGGDGTIELSGVNLRSAGAPAITLNGGSVEMVGGSLRTDVLGYEHAAAIIVNALSDVSLSFRGTYIEVNDSTSSASVIKVCPELDGADVDIYLGTDGDTAARVSKCGGIVFADFASATAQVELLCDSVDLFELGELAAFGNASAEERRLVKIVARNAAIAVQYSGALAVSPEGIPLYSPADPTLPAVPVENVDIEAFTSLYIWRGLDVIVYVPTDSDIVRVALGGEVAFDINLKDTYAIETVDGRECYAAVCSYFAPSLALCDATLTRFFAKGDAEYRYDSAYSIIDYCEDILLGDYAEETKTLILDTLVYIRDAHLFFSTKIEKKDMERLNALIGDYEGADVELDGVNTMSSLSKLVKSVQFNAGSTPSFTLTLTEAAKTENIIVYSAHLFPVVVAAGESSGSVTIELPLFALNDVINVRIGDKTAQYSFAAYAQRLDAFYSDSSLSDACMALLRLGESARSYKNYAEGGTVPDTPMVDLK